MFSFSPASKSSPGPIAEESEMWVMWPWFRSTGPSSASFSRSETAGLLERLDVAIIRLVRLLAEIAFSCSAWIEDEKIVVETPSDM